MTVRSGMLPTTSQGYTWLRLRIRNPSVVGISWATRVPQLMMLTLLLGYHNGNFPSGLHVSCPHVSVSPHASNFRIADNSGVISSSPNRYPTAAISMQACLSGTTLCEFLLSQCRRRHIHLKCYARHNLGSFRTQGRLSAVPSDRALVATVEFHTR